MTTPVIAFFNNKGGVGKTSLVYHLAWMYSDMGLSVVAADLDPQANLTAAFLDTYRLEELWPDGDHPDTIFGSLQPLLIGTGDIANPHLEHVGSDQLTLFGGYADQITLLVGDLSLSRFEDQLSEAWPKCLDEDQRAFRVISAFWRIMQRAATQSKADIILMDLGPNLGAINRAALIAADYVAMPLAPDLFSLQGLQNLGPTLRTWRKNWQSRLLKNPNQELILPSGRMEPIGYIILQHSVRVDRAVQAYDQWIARIPREYRESVLDEHAEVAVSPTNDPYCLALIKHYRSLMAMAQEARKPMFHLQPADGAIGSHTRAVQDAYKDFQQLARNIAGRTGIVLPT
ncbi:MAG TPA: AAA family ATPase [Ktedonobacteraceae bacterium]|nr:AAA family ATPase [Ktedonobacteraceae bacterium]